MGPRCPSCGLVHELSIGELEERVVAPKFFFCERCLSLFVVSPEEIARHQERYHRAEGRDETPPSRDRAPKRRAREQRPDPGNSDLARRLGRALHEWIVLRRSPALLVFELADGSRIDLAEPVEPGLLLLVGSARRADCAAALPRLARQAQRAGLRLLWIPAGGDREAAAARAVAERCGLGADCYACSSEALARRLAARLGREDPAPLLPPVLCYLDGRSQVGWIGPYPPAGRSRGR